MRRGRRSDVRNDAKGSPPHADHALRDAGQPDADAGLHDRQCGAAVHAGQHVGQRRRDHLGADLLRDRRRDHDRAGRLDGGAVRPQEPVHRLHERASPSPPCCAARRQSLEQMVGFRLLQGMCGAALVPLSQATMLDIYPFERRAQAMAIFSMGVTVGPIIGPTLGGYLTDIYNWRWVFYVNLPFGILAITGLAAVHAEDAAAAELRFAWYGFAVLAIGVGALADDAGPRPGAGLVLLARDHRRGGAGGPRPSICSSCTCSPPSRPFLPPGLFKDRNFVSASSWCSASSSRDAGDVGAAGALSAEPGGLSGRIPPAGSMAPRGIGTSRRCSSPPAWACGWISARSWRSAC